jgi:3-hydroxybutyryl-CoA dehydrogenase
MDERLAVLGTGTIGLALARLAAASGDAVVWARSDASARNARRGLAEAAERAGQPPGTAHITTELEELRRCTFVIEAVAEDQRAKTAILRRSAGVVGPTTIVATTTSSLSVSALGRAAGLSGQFIGLHPFNPVHRMRLVELVYPDGTTPGTRRRAEALCLALDKTAIEAPDIPGFVVNGLLFPYLFSAVRLLDRGELSADDVDACMTLGAGMPLGPLALLDLVGLDVAVAIGESLGEAVPDRLRELVANGRLGRKSGRGFHRHGSIAPLVGA